MLEARDMKRWFIDSMTEYDTPLTLLLEWIVGECVDVINCAASLCEHKPYVPITSGHASEWVLSIIELLHDSTQGLSSFLTTCGCHSLIRQALSSDIELVTSSHASRLPEPADVDQASKGIPVMMKRAVYLGESASITSYLV